MADWFLRRVLLHGLPPATVQACLSQREVRTLLRFRFAYLFAFHGPVLIPLLEALGGQQDPALSVLSLGVASVAMVLSDVPTGLYADRHGSKAALRLGLRLSCIVLVAFFALTVARAHSLQQGQTGPWLPGIVGLLVLEGAIGVSLSLLSGADTVLFLGVLRRAGIQGLQSTGSEGLGSAIRYIGTMISVAIGALLYDLSAWLLPHPALRLALQSGLFLLTLGSQLVALKALQRIAEVPSLTTAPRIRPGFQDVVRGLHALTRFPAFAVQLWLLCLLSAIALFAVYLFQSPLSRLTTELVKTSWLFSPIYVITAVLGYWACSRGSRDAHRVHDRDVEALTPTGNLSAARSPATATEPNMSPASLVDPPAGLAITTPLTGLALGLLLLYPLVDWARLAWQGPAPSLSSRLGFVAVAAVSCLLFNYIRGFVEPYSAATLVRFTQAHALAVPASIISGFNSLKRGMHFLLSVLFYAVRTRGPSASGLDRDHDLSRMLLYVVGGLMLLALPGLWRHRLRPPPIGSGTGESLSA